MTAEIEAAALERVARHLDALRVLDIRPAAESYLRERAAKLRVGDGWEDDDLLAALASAESTPAEPRPQKTARIAIPCHPGCTGTVCFDGDDLP